uniref:HTH psq-type domain-containing protein n=1 Tax=Acrobeloides nanus TaxID=290746 RepID=A0A914C7Z6_9BILA
MDGANKNSIAKALGTSKTSIRRIVSSKERIQEVFIDGCGPNCKRLMKAQHKELETALVDWMKRLLSSLTPVTGDLKALMLNANVLKKS